MPMEHATKYDEQTRGSNWKNNYQNIIKNKGRAFSNPSRERYPKFEQGVQKFDYW